MYAFGFFFFLIWDLLTVKQNGPLGYAFIGNLFMSTDCRLCWRRSHTAPLPGEAQSLVFCPFFFFAIQPPWRARSFPTSELQSPPRADDSGCLPWALAQLPVFPAFLGRTSRLLRSACPLQMLWFPNLPRPSGLQHISTPRASFQAQEIERRVKENRPFFSSSLRSNGRSISARKQVKCDHDDDGTPRCWEVKGEQG